MADHTSRFAADYVAQLTSSGTPLQHAITALAEIGSQHTYDTAAAYWYSVAAQAADAIARASHVQTPDVSPGEWCDFILHNMSITDALISTLAEIGALKPLSPAQIWWLDVAAILAAAMRAVPHR